MNPRFFHRLCRLVRLGLWNDYISIVLMLILLAAGVLAAWVASHLIPDLAAPILPLALDFNDHFESNKLVSQPVPPSQRIFSLAALFLSLVFLPFR